MGQDLRNIPRPRNNRHNSIGHHQRDQRALRYRQPGGQRHPFSTLPTLIPDTNGRLLLLEPR